MKKKLKVKKLKPVETCTKAGGKIPYSVIYAIIRAFQENELTEKRLEAIRQEHLVIIMERKGIPVKWYQVGK